MDEMGLDAEAMQRYIATMPHMTVDLSTSPSNSAHSPKPDCQPRSGSVDLSKTGPHGDKQAKSGEDAAKSGPEKPLVIVSAPSLDTQVKSAVDSSHNLSVTLVVKEETDNGKSTPLTVGCDVPYDGDVIVVKQEYEDSGSNGTSGCVEEKELMVLTLGKKDVVSSKEGLEGDSILNGRDLGSKKCASSGPTSDVVFKKSKSENARPSLNDVISNLSHGASLLSDAVPQNSSNSVSSLLWTKLSKPPAPEEKEQELEGKQQEEKASNLTIHKPSWFSMPSLDKPTSPAISCQPPATSCEEQRQPQQTSTSPCTPPVSTAGSAHQTPVRRRGRKSGTRDGWSPTASTATRGSAGSKTSLSALSSATVNSRPSPVAPPNASLFPLPYNPILSPVYDYNLPDRGLSSATASIMAANPRFAAPHLASQPFMMSYFPLQPMWSGAGTVAIAAAAAANMSIPTPLDLSSPNKVKSEPAEKTSREKSSSPVKELPIKSVTSQPTPSQANHQNHGTKETSRRGSRGSHSKGGKSQTRASGEKFPPSSLKGNDKDVENPKKEVENSVHETYPECGSRSHELNISKARYEKNLLLFGDQEIEIMSVGKLRWVVRNEADLLRIAQANLKKSSPVCDSGTLILEANSSTETSLYGEGSPGKNSRDRSDCSVSSSVRREDGEPEEGVSLNSGTERTSSPLKSNRTTDQQDMDYSPSPSKCPKLDKTLSSPKDLSKSKLVNGKLDVDKIESGAAVNLPNFLLDLNVSESVCVKHCALSSSLLTRADQSCVVKPSSSTPTSPPTGLKQKHEGMLFEEADKSSSTASPVNTGCTSTDAYLAKEEARPRHKCGEEENISRIVPPSSVLLDGRIVPPSSVSLDDEALSKEYSLLSSMLKSAH